MQLGYLSYGYAMFLTIYYVLTICYNLQERFIATYLEPIMHLFVLGFGLLSAILNVVWEYAGPGLPTCWVGSYPTGCIPGEDSQSPYPCIRGEGFEEFGRWVIVYPSFLFTVVNCICLATVVWTVWQRRQLARRFIFKGTSQNQNGSSDNLSSDAIGNTCANVNTSNSDSTQRLSSSSLHRSSSTGPLTLRSSSDTNTRRMDTVVIQCLL